MRTLLALVAVQLLASPASAQVQPIVFVGGERGSVELGTILDVVAVPGGWLLLDKSAPHLRLIGENGQVRQTIGRSGSGPGEYSVPSALSFDSASGRVLVVDRANARVTEYDVGDTLRLALTLPTSVVSLRDVCVLQGRLFGVSGSRTRLIEELEVQDGRLVASRGLGRPRSAHPLADHRLVIGRSSEGPMYCDPRGFVWVASRVLGEVHRISLDGVQQTVAIQAFRPIRLQAGGGDRLTFSMPEEGWYEEIASLIATSSGVRVIVSRIDRNGAVSFQSLDLTPDFASQGARVSSKWNQVGGSRRGVICIVNDPAPAMAVYAGSQCP